jgi:hypothetical protein
MVIKNTLTSLLLGTALLVGSMGCQITKENRDGPGYKERALTFQFKSEGSGAVNLPKRQVVTADEAEKDAYTIAKRVVDRNINDFERKVSNEYVIYRAVNDSGVRFQDDLLYPENEGSFDIVVINDKLGMFSAGINIIDNHAVRHYTGVNYIQLGENAAKYGYSERITFQKSTIEVHYLDPSGIWRRSFTDGTLRSSVKDVKDLLFNDAKMSDVRRYEDLVNKLKSKFSSSHTQ